MSAHPQIDGMPSWITELARFHQAGSQQWAACCPAHSDGTPSLRISQSDTKLALYCHAGCPTEAVVAAVGKTMADLNLGNTSKRVGPVEIAVRYPYASADGEVLYAVSRRAGGRKGFMYQHPGPDGEWVSGQGSSGHLLYGLPRLLTVPDGQEVWCTEGEKDAESLWSIGLAATTVSSGSWGKADLSALAGKNLVVICDADDRGISFGHGRVESLALAGLTVEPGRVLFPRVTDVANPDISDVIEVAVAHYGRTHGADSEVVRDVVWSMLHPVSEWLGKRTIADRMNGRFAYVTSQVLATDKKHRLAENVYLRLALLASGSTEAHATIKDLAAHLGAGRNQVANAIAYLIEQGCLREIKKGRYFLPLNVKNSKTGKYPNPDPKYPSERVAPEQSSDASDAFDELTASEQRETAVQVDELNASQRREPFAPTLPEMVTIAPRRFDPFDDPPF